MLESIFQCRSACYTTPGSHLKLLATILRVALEIESGKSDNKNPDAPAMNTQPQAQRAGTSSVICSQCQSQSQPQSNLTPHALKHWRNIKVDRHVEIWLSPLQQLPKNQVQYRFYLWEQANRTYQEAEVGRKSGMLRVTRIETIRRQEVSGSAIKFKNKYLRQKKQMPNSRTKTRALYKLR